MSYHLFAQIYDELMDEALYSKWLDIVTKWFGPDRTILELGCGTGRLAVELKKIGYSISGLDLSSDMLSLAYNRAQENGVNFPLIEGDMRDLSELGKYDAIISFCDSLCYLETKEDVKKVLEEVFTHLYSGGVFLFDVHSLYQMSLFNGYSFHAELENVVFLWDSFEGVEKHSVEHELSFFVQKEKELYTRSFELHRERTYPLAEYKKMLEDVGFKNIEVSADFGEKVVDTSKRWFFKAEK